MHEVDMYTDGAARGNPDGPGGYGTIIKFTDAKGVVHERQFSKGYIRTTNNRMELMACIIGFEALTKPCKVKVYSDSKYLTDAFNKSWVASWIKNNWVRPKVGPVKNVDLWKRLLKAMEKHQTEYIWIKGHAGHPENELCDKLATSAALSGNLENDEGLEL
jgi:ribonuclease H